MSSVTRRLSAALEGSIVVTTLRTIYDKSALIATAWESSKVSTLVETATRWIRGSYIHQWLTKKPDPDVVAIDLQDTVIISLFLSIFEKMIQIVSSSATSTPERNE